MNKRLSSKFKMMKALVELYMSNQAKFDVLAAVAAAMVVFKNAIATIEALIPKAEEDTTSMTRQRDALRQALYQSTMAITEPVSAYAAGIGDLVLEAEMDWTVPKLKKIRQDQLGASCTSLYEKATTLLTEATPNGLTQAKLNKQKADNGAWIAKESATRSKQVEISEAKQQIRNAINKNMNLLEKQLDRSVYALSESDAELYDLWVKTREVEAPHTTSTQVKVFVANTEDDEPLYAANLELVNGVVHKAVTNTAGEAMFQKKLKPGLYKFKAYKPGFKDFEIIEYRVFLGKINRLEVKLEPVAEE